MGNVEKNAWMPGPARRAGHRAVQWQVVGGYFDDLWCVVSHDAEPCYLKLNVSVVRQN
jgi:hypothetical protein